MFCNSTIALQGKRFLNCFSYSYFTNITKLDNEHNYNLGEKVVRTISTEHTPLL